MSISQKLVTSIIDSSLFSKVEPDVKAGAERLFYGIVENNNAFKRLDTSLENISSSIKNNSDGISSLSTEFKQNLDSQKNTINSFASNILNNFTNLSSRFGQINSEVNSVKSGFYQNQNIIRDLNDTIERIGIIRNQDISKFNEDSQELLARIDQNADRLSQAEASIRSLEDSIQSLSESISSMGGSGGGGSALSSAAGAAAGLAARTPIGRALTAGAAALGGLGVAGAAASTGGSSTSPTGDTGGSSTTGGGSFAGSSDDFFGAIQRAEGTDIKKAQKHGFDSPYDVVLGYGKYGKPDKPLSQMTIREVYDFQRNVLLPGHGSSSAAGAFQIVSRNIIGKDGELTAFMKRAGLSLDDKFDEVAQKKLAYEIYKEQGLGAWEGFKHHPNERKRAAAAANDVRLERSEENKQAPEGKARPEDKTTRSIDGVEAGKSRFGPPIAPGLEGASTDARPSRLTKEGAEEKFETEVLPELQDVSRLFGQKLKINDAIPHSGSSRERETKGSRHFHGDAVDISTVGMNNEQKIQLMEYLKSQGFRGFGLGNTILHADRRSNAASWNYGNKSWAGMKIADAEKLAKAALSKERQKQIDEQLEKLNETASSEETGVDQQSLTETMQDVNHPLAPRGKPEERAQQQPPAPDTGASSGFISSAQAANVDNNNIPTQEEIDQIQHEMDLQRRELLQKKGENFYSDLESDKMLDDNIFALMSDADLEKIINKPLVVRSDGQPGKPGHKAREELERRRSQKPESKPVPVASTITPDAERPDLQPGQKTPRYVSTSSKAGQPHVENSHDIVPQNSSYKNLRVLESCKEMLEKYSEICKNGNGAKLDNRLPQDYNSPSYHPSTVGGIPDIPDYGYKL